MMIIDKFKIAHKAHGKKPPNIKFVCMILRITGKAESYSYIYVFCTATGNGRMSQSLTGDSE